MCVRKKQFNIKIMSVIYLKYIRVKAASSCFIYNRFYLQPMSVFEMLPSTNISTNSKMGMVAENIKKNW